LKARLRNEMATSPEVMAPPRSPVAPAAAPAAAVSVEHPARALGPLSGVVDGLSFQNPVLLAAGTAAYGREVADVIDLESLGGLVTKAVSLQPRAGAAPLRVGEFRGGMINAVGLANPGVDRVLAEDLPWLASNVSRARVVVNVVGFAVEEFAAVVE